MLPGSPIRRTRALATTGLALFLVAAFVATPAPASAAPPSGLGLAAAPASSAEITYRKIFKTSYPKFVEIKINEAGAGTYDIRQLDEDANPQPFEIGAPLVERIFSLAAKLHDFQGVDLDVHRRLANLGEKTFVYENGTEKHETKFNYTLDEAASQLVNIFEGLARQTADISDLARTMRYDRLGVNDVLLQIESDLNTKQIPEPERLLPTLTNSPATTKFWKLPASARVRSPAASARETSAFSATVCRGVPRSFGPFPVPPLRLSVQKYNLTHLITCVDPPPRSQVKYASR